MKRYKIVIEAVEPIHVGGERGLRPPVIDLSVERRIILRPDGSINEEVVIPGSSLKGVVRHVVEDALRLFVRKQQEPLNRIFSCAYKVCKSKFKDMYSDAKVDPLLHYIGFALGSTIWCVAHSVRGAEGHEANLRYVVSHLKRVLASSQQVLSEDLLPLTSVDADGATQSILLGMKCGYSMLSEEAPPSEVEQEFNNIAKLAFHTIVSLFPVVCDPTSNIGCLPDTIIFRLGEEIETTIRFVLSIALLRKVPLKLEVCPVCSVFGTTGRSSATLFRDARARLLESKALPTQTRVSIDRMTWAAKRGRLFVLEYVPPGTRFESEVVILDEYLPHYLDADSVMLLIIEALSSRPLGGLKSVGMGWIKVHTSNFSRPCCKKPEDILGKMFRMHVTSIVKTFSESRAVWDILARLKEILVSAGRDEEEVNRIVEAIRKLINTLALFMHKGCTNNAYTDA